MATLKEFVKEALSEITEALIEFTEEKGETGASPHPDGLQIPHTVLGQKFLFAATKEENAQYNDVVAIIDFDVAVTAVEEKKKKGGVGVKVLSAFTAEGAVENANVGTNVSRLKFPVPFRLPKVEAKRDRTSNPTPRRRKTTSSYLSSR